MLSGLLLVDKPAGWTSHDVAQFVRSRLPGKPKVGHTGTLDPLATGLLVLLVGPATRKQAEFQKQRKTYEGRLRLGIVTETGDIEGKVTKTAEVPPLSIERLQGLAAGLTGKRTYNAPAYSALKHKGRPMYYYARKGVEVPAKEKEMEVFRWDIVSYEPPEVSFVMDVASGTYVRSVAEALGAELGCGAAVSALRRTTIGAFDIKDAVREADIRGQGADFLVKALVPVGDA